MELTRAEKINDRKYPGYDDMKSLYYQCAFYSFGSIVLTHRVYLNVKKGANIGFVSVMGLLGIMMLNYKVDIVIDLGYHMKKYPELYQLEVEGKS